MTEHPVMEIDDRPDTPDAPMLSISWPDGRRIEVWTDGRSTGIDDDCIVVNRAPVLISERVHAVLQQLTDAKAFSSHPTGYFAKVEVSPRTIKMPK